MNIRECGEYGLLKLAAQRETNPDADLMGWALVWLEDLQDQVIKLKTKITKASLELNKP